MAFWATEIKPSKTATPLILERRVVIKQAALVITKPSPEPCVLSVSVKASDQRFVVCRLHEGRMEHCTLELPFSPSDGCQLHLSGPHTVHLTGFLELEDEDELEERDEPRGQNGTRLPVIDDDDDDDDDDEFVDEEGEEEEEEEEEEVVIMPGKKRAITSAPPPGKKPKAPAAASPAAAPKAATPAAAAPASKKAAVTTPVAEKKKAAAAKSTPSAALEATPAASGKKPTAGATTDAKSPLSPATWTAEEDSKLQKALSKYPADTAGRWEKIATDVGSRSSAQCKKRAKGK